MSAWCQNAAFSALEGCGVIDRVRRIARRTLRGEIKVPDEDWLERLYLDLHRYETPDELDPLLKEAFCQVAANYGIRKGYIAAREQ